MVVIAWIGSLMGRRGDGLAALSLAVCIMLAARPMAAFDVSVKAGEEVVFEVNVTLEDYGTGAKSALPDHN